MPAITTDVTATWFVCFVTFKHIAKAAVRQRDTFVRDSRA